MSKKPEPRGTAFGKITPRELLTYADGVISNVMGDLIENKPVLAFNRLKHLREFMVKHS